MTIPSGSGSCRGSAMPVRISELNYLGFRQVFRWIASNIEIVICLVAFPVIMTTIWLMMQNATHKIHGYELQSEINEIQWRSAQIREELVGLKVALIEERFAGGNYIDHSLSVRSEFIIANIFGLLSQRFSKRLISEKDAECLQSIIRFLEERGLTDEKVGQLDVLEINAVIHKFIKEVRRITSIANNYSYVQAKKEEQERQSSLLKLCYTLLITFLIVFALWFILHRRSKAKYDNEVRQFSLLFAHMTVTRINGLKWWAQESLRPNKPCDPRLLSIARSRIDYLNVMTTWLTRIAYPGDSSMPANAVLLHDVVTEIASRSHEPKPRFSIAPDAAEITLQRGHVQLILDELLANAQDALAHDCDPRIAIIARIDRNAFGRKHLRVSVIDNGPGMTEQQIKLAQSPFYSTKGEVSGHSGLGLFGCIQLVKAIKGKFQISSAPGKGTRMTFTYPINQSF